MTLWHPPSMSNVLTFNGGSSSMRIAVYDAEDTTTKLLDGKIERIGAGDASMTVNELQQDGGDTQQRKYAKTTMALGSVDASSVAEFLMRWLGSHRLFASVSAVGHRVVHGMQHATPERVTPELVKELKGIAHYDPEHLPREIAMIETVSRAYPDLPQVACFDTAFHRSMPREATLLPIPRRYASKGVQRYGFHGLSYTYLMAELARLGDPAATRGRVILAHLGNGASLAAVRDGKSIDTSMGFTPTAGLVMSSRCGDLDPGIVNFLASTDSMSAARFDRMVNHESGLLGISETSSDIRDLLAAEASDVRAAEAVTVFCYQVKKWIGAYAAALGGVDTLVFAGGIGENAATIRSRICAGLGFLGIELDEAGNASGAATISNVGGKVVVRVIRTDEESVIATSTLRVLGASSVGH
jgi:acetate kinase